MKKVLFVLLMLWAFVGKGQEARLVLPLGIPGSVEDVIFSNGSKYLILFTFPSDATIFETDTGKEIFKIEGEAKFATFSKNDELILVYDSKGVRLIELKTGKEILAIVLPKGEIHYASFDPEEKEIILYDNEDSAFVFDKKNGNKLTEFYVPHKGNLNKPLFCKDGKRILTVKNDTIFIINYQTKKTELKIGSHTQKITKALFSNDAEFIVSSALDSTVLVHNSLNGNLIYILKNHSNRVNSINISKQDKFITTASSDSTVCIYDFKTGKLLEKINFQDELLESKFSPDLKYLLVRKLSDSLIIYDTNLKRTVKKIQGNHAVFNKGENKMIVTLIPSMIMGLNHLTIHTTGTICCRVFNAKNLTEEFNISGRSDKIGNLHLQPNSNTIINRLSYLSDFNSRKFVKGFDLNTGKTIVKLDIKHEYGIDKMKFSGDGDLMLTRSFKELKINKLSNGIQIFNLVAKSDEGFCGALFSKDEKKIIVYADTYNNENKTIGYKIWCYEIISGKLIFEISDTNKIALLVGIESNTDKIFLCTEEQVDTTVINSVLTFDLKGHKLSEAKHFSIKNGDIVHSHNFKYILNKQNNLLWQSVDNQFKYLKLDKNIKIYQCVFSKERDYMYILTGQDSLLRYGIINDHLETIQSEDKPYLSSYTGYDHKIFLSNDDSFLLKIDGKSLLLIDAVTLKQKKIFDGHTDFISDAIFLKGNKFILTTGNDNRTILWDAATGKQLYTRLQLQNGDWLVYDEHYRYDGSQGARDYLYFVCGLEVVDLAQVKDALYVPNLVQRIMNGENLDHLPKLKDLEICGVTPEVEPNDNKKDGGYYYQIKARKGGVGKVEIYINGVLRQTLESKTLAQKDGVYELKIDEKLIQQYQIADKETEIKVIARTADNKISSRGAVARTTAKETVYRKPSLHAIMVGIDDYKGEGLDLNYAAKDAIDLQTALKISTQKLFNVDDTNRVHFYNLTLDRGGNINGLTPDRNNILKTLEKIEKESKPEDVFVLFFAGHGEINPEKQLILLTAEASKEQAPNYSGILMKELLEKLAKIPAGKRILLLDACHSGAAINELNIKDIAGVRDGEDAEKQSQRLKELENLASKSGLSIITASSTEQKAMELPQYEHGLMTYALLTTMLNDPEVLDKDNNLQLEDWLRQTEKNVSKLIENQSAQRFVPVNFSVGKVDDAVRKSIVLQEIPTLVVANVMNLETGDDDQDIESKLIKKLNEISTRGGTDKILIAEKDGPNAISVNLSYELSEGKIKSKITLKKDKKVFKQFNFEGIATDLNKFVEDLSKEITKNLK